MSTHVASPDVPPIPLHRERLTKLSHKKLASWDIETQGEKLGEALYGEICYNGICLLIPEQEPLFFSTISAFLAHVLEYMHGYYLAAHNGKGYEFNYLLDTLRDMLSTDDGYTIETLHQGDTIIGYEIQRTTEHTITRGKRRGTIETHCTKWHFIDTLPLFNMSLREVANAFCPDMPKGDIDWKNENWNYYNATHRAYLVRDCEIILRAYSTLETMLYDTFNCRVGRTAGSTAMHAFKASIPEGHVYYRNNATVERFMRRGYRGGLVLPGTTTQPQSHMAMLDVKGAYGYQMLTNEYPIGAPVHTFRYQPGYVGMYHVRVTTPHSLPFAIIAQEATSCYPLGTFNTVCTSVEIEYALSLGYQFTVYEGYYYTRQEPVFRVFMKTCQEIETRQITDTQGVVTTPFKPLAKLLRNSLYGKFATKETAEKFVLLSPGQVPPADAGILIDEETGYIIEGLYTQQQPIDEPYIMPIWAALITAYERVYLAQRAYALYAAGAPSVYADTDSLAAHVDAVERVRILGLLPNTKQYGSWENEGIANVMIVAAPKVYILLDENNHKIKARAKGLPMNQLQERYPDIFSYDTYAQATQDIRSDYFFTTSNSVRTRLKHPALPIKRERHRKISLISRSPNWEYHTSTGTISPKHIYEDELPLAQTPLTVYTPTSSGDAKHGVS